MRSWPASEVPSLSDAGLPAATRPLSLHDTATGTARPTSPGATARMYVCGITPYDATHLGHANTYLAFDLVNRVWRDLGHRVHYVQNATDVDDPLLERARETGEDWRELADREIELFRGDMTALRILPPDQYVGAVEAIPLIVEMIEKLRGRDAAYEVAGDVYFPVASDPSFGQVSGLTREEMAPLSAERGGDPDRAGKRDPLDALLWMARRPGEPGWESPFGEGRPGWHVECSAISVEYLGMAFDVEGGGSDLAFPHHEMGASHAQVATGERPHARAYVHAGMVGLDGEKMSKSRGNLVFVSRLREAGTDPMAIRLALLAHHYRADWEWTPGALDEASARLRRWRDAVARPSGPPAEGLAAAVRGHLADDLDAPAALAAVDAWAASAGTDTAAPSQARAIADALLGVAL
ncbi:cysteine--1-D-myo-inosityl 2-amino-2-deoxy-alpha-D-glucopyranoside ligase [Actinomadura madurae]|uniref:L-cysteine:1D-myo-inositol 2-amino-2-deoxy-alpha-D-glucopyranoside ligase n=1 Tax=Actinomadura madurae TaxID=1993 RepID=A0A1I5K462_9ACTN|nr:cysteine--1-D-myo-inosityl 2-amino-2-deoxy-alpha-D-glucopyranoside ligase [Actinomadura madurae]SFO79787.1 L-cysteine:1D-myo-inositol 2-amino-2-deoxy-alpha-D-glucopyranoside ligase [Actinomadura madurae]SPT56720.1 L-cysteine:1D-myo-inositol 2-amino-2-deoxy-alpha-D-glucopyranoside ligase [Actinomadura madurae]